MTSQACTHCGRPLAIASRAMVRAAIANTGAEYARWKNRLHGPAVYVCPPCDAYALGVEHDAAVPFYSDDLCAFATVHDWDWWNEDPAQCDTRSWPSFGCVTLSETALRGANELGCSDMKGCPEPREGERRADLAERAGFPPDARAYPRWEDELDALARDLAHQYNRCQLDQATRTLIALLPAARPSANSTASGIQA